MDDASNTLHRTSAEAFDEPSTQYQLKIAQQRLQSWKMSIPEGIDVRESSLNFYLGFINILIHLDRAP
jgi:hypothetical protein